MGVAMRYYKIVSGGYILSFGIGNGGTEITEEQYNELLNVLANKPEETDSIGYMLKDDLTWEQFEKEPVPEPEIDDSEALSILLGGEE